MEAATQQTGQTTTQRAAATPAVAKLDFAQPVYYDGHKATYIGQVPHRPGRHLVETTNGLKPKIVTCDEYGNLDNAVEGRRARRVINEFVRIKSSMQLYIEALEAEIVRLGGKVPEQPSGGTQ